MLSSVTVDAKINVYFIALTACPSFTLLSVRTAGSFHLAVLVYFNTLKCGSTAITRHQLQITSEVPIQRGISISDCRIAHCYSIGKKISRSFINAEFSFFLKNRRKVGDYLEWTHEFKAVIKSLLLREIDQQNED